MDGYAAIHGLNLHTSRHPVKAPGEVESQHIVDIIRLQFARFLHNSPLIDTMGLQLRPVNPVNQKKQGFISKIGREIR